MCASSCGGRGSCGRLRVGGVANRAWNLQGGFRSSCLGCVADVRRLQLPPWQLLWGQLGRWRGSGGMAAARWVGAGGAGGFCPVGAREKSDVMGFGRRIRSAVGISHAIAGGKSAAVVSAQPQPVYSEVKRSLPRLAHLPASAGGPSGGAARAVRPGQRWQLALTIGLGSVPDDAHLLHSSGCSARLAKGFSTRTPS